MLIVLTDLSFRFFFPDCTSKIRENQETEAVTSREQVYEMARQAKANAYPRKDSSGRLLNESFCIPFILTSMGGLCDEGHDFLRLCKMRN